MAGRPRDERPVSLDADRSAVEAARREPRQFETLYRKYVGQVYSYAFYELRDRQAAEDLTAQVFLQALAALPRFQDRTDELGGTSSFRVWLFRIARNLVSNERRSRRRHPTAPIEAAEFVAGPGDPAAAAAERDELRRAWQVVSRLPDDRRRAVVLRFVHEMTPGEIGAILGRSEGSVRVLIHRALRNVADELRRSHPADPGADA
jgi:RNA polymerase sigma-70 factor (ECF subfamily)